MNKYDANYQIYLFECDWYNECNDKDEHARGLTMAPSFAEAIQAITDRLPYANHIAIHEWEDRQFVFLNKSLYNRMLDENNEYGLDFPDEIIKAEESAAVAKPSPHTNPEDTYREDFSRDQIERRPIKQIDGIYYTVNEGGALSKLSYWDDENWGWDPQREKYVPKYIGETCENNVSDSSALW